MFKRSKKVELGLIPKTDIFWTLLTSTFLIQLLAIFYLITNLDLLFLNFYHISFYAEENIFVLNVNYSNNSQNFFIIITISKASKAVLYIQSYTM
jgi:hypothetical protein